MLYLAIEAHIAITIFTIRSYSLIFMAGTNEGSTFNLWFLNGCLILKSLSAMLVVFLVVVKIDLILLIAFLASKCNPFFSFLALFYIDYAFLAGWMATFQQDRQVFFGK